MTYLEKNRQNVVLVSFVVAIFFFISKLAFAQSPADAQTVPTTQAAAQTAQTNVSLDFKDADINNVLRILSLKSGVNIVAGPEVVGTVTIRLENVPWEKALDVVLRTYGYVYERDGNIVRVTTKTNVTSEELQTETFVLNYTTAAEAEEAIKDILSERGRIKSVPRTNMIIVTDIPTNLMKIREVIKKLDKSTPQAHIDSKIIDTQLQEGENLGITWTPAGTLSGAQKPVTFPFSAYNKEGSSDAFEQLLGRFFPQLGTGALDSSSGSTSTSAINPVNPRSFPRAALPDPGGNTYTFGTLNFQSFNAVLQFLKTRGNTKIVSNPRITVLNNQTAKIQVGTDIPLPTFERNETSGSFEISGYSFRNTGVTMNVTPHINDADEILVNLKPEISASSGTTSFASSGSLTQLPNFTVTSAETQVLIKNGETIAIGGLLTDTSQVTENKVPVLGDIPILGKIFKSKDKDQGTSNQKKETLFFVTVTIVDTEGEPTKNTTPQSANITTGTGGQATAQSNPSNIPVERING